MKTKAEANGVRMDRMRADIDITYRFELSTPHTVVGARGTEVAATVYNISYTFDLSTGEWQTVIRAEGRNMKKKNLGRREVVIVQQDAIPRKMLKKIQQTGTTALDDMLQEARDKYIAHVTGEKTTDEPLVSREGVAAHNG